MMQEAFLNISSVPTHIISWGPWVGESFSKKEVVIGIPGSPGLPGFYADFMSTIHQNIDPDIPVWLIGQAGQDEPPESSMLKILPLLGNEEKYDLDAQVKHKLQFIEKYVPRDVKIHLIGHSIGAWMIIQMLKNSAGFRHRIQHAYLLFPTIERMATSSNGLFFTKTVLPLLFLLRYIVNIFSQFPISVQALMLSYYFSLSSIPQHFVGTALKYARPSIMEKVLYLANEEMTRLNELDSATLQTLRANHKILKFYYGENDGWTPNKYIYELKKKIPELDLEMDENKIEHAFVLKSSVEVGKLVAKWIHSRNREIIRLKGRRYDFSQLNLTSIINY